MKTIVLLLTLASAAQAIDLAGEWRHHAGDNPRWAAPDFDDSSWAIVTMPLAPRRSGRYWIRRQFQLTEPIASPAIALGRFARCYEVYLNGVRAVTTCPEVKTAYFPPRWFRLTKDALPAGSTITLALRVDDDTLPLGFLRAFGDDGPYFLGTWREAVAAGELAALQRRHSIIPTWLATNLQLVFAALLFLYWLIGGRRPEFLRFAGFLMGAGLFNVLQLVSAYQEIDRRWCLLFLIAGYGCLGSSLAALSGRGAGVAWATAGASAVLMISDLTRFSGFVSGAILLAPLLPTAAWAGQVAWRKAPFRKVASLVLLYVAFALNTVPEGLVPGWPVPSAINAGLFQVYLATWISAAFGLAVGLLMIQNAVRERREQARLAQEMEAARSVQQFLIPAAAAPGIDAVYLPATEVGGDFWHLLDGHLLVVGDVSGKGLKAAMVVSLITGMLDRRHSDSPAAILAELNRALHARLDGAFVTCCVTRLDNDGQVTLASAGHPSPYIDGREIELTGGLPLGILPDASYDETVLTFGHQLTLVSDGVVEAENTQRELFGFDRTREISTMSAQHIADAAQAWGQTDDITVVTVRRTS